MIKRALLSVSDKTGIVDLAKKLESLDVEIISTGGTAKTLIDAGIKVTNISDVTGFPECLDGRVKTLHPNVHAGILANRNCPEHMRQLDELNVTPIDMVVINLYPFKETILKDGVTLKDAIENIDIGGPTMIRAAAKNYKDVVVVVDPKDYDDVIKEIEANGDVSLDKKFKLALKVFEHTSSYDTLIAGYIREQIGDDTFPENFTVTYEKAQDLRYGENPHQKAVFYKEIGTIKGTLANCKQLHGKELSYNNINDANGALALLKEFTEPTVVACKHANPCGVASSSNIYDAYVKAYESDPVSVFGGIIAANREIDKATAEEMSKIFLEIIIAPSFTDEALEILTQKKNIRLLKLDDILEPASPKTYDMKKVLGGLLVQEHDNTVVDLDDLKVVTEKSPSKEELDDLIFTMKVVKHAKSNAIAIGKDKQTLGVGPGQTNRVLAARIAIDYGKDRTKGAVMASDAFFPFSDCVEVAAKAGITAIIQPGGSIRDQESIDACNKHGIAMVFTGMRHFKH